MACRSKHASNVVIIWGLSTKIRNLCRLLFLSLEYRIILLLLIEMQITRYIQELLYQHECVTIPHFGAFLTRSFGAQVSSEGHFFPPRKEVNFNQLLVANDGVCNKMQLKSID